jgi:hypothetical protein
MSIYDWSSDQTTNSVKIVQADTRTGQQNTASYLPFNPYPPIGVGHSITKEGFDKIKALQGYPDNNPKTAVGAKKLPLELVPPSAVHALAEAFSDGATKYGAYNWRDKTISSSVYYGAALRHIQAWWDGEDVASDSGIPHLHHALACLAMLIDGYSVGKLNDNRPPKGAASSMQKNWAEKNETGT